LKGHSASCGEGLDAEKVRAVLFRHGVGAERASCCRFGRVVRLSAEVRLSRKAWRGGRFAASFFVGSAQEVLMQHELPASVSRSSRPWARPASTASRRWLSTAAPRSRGRFRRQVHAHHVAASSAHLAMAMPNQRALVRSSHVLVDPLTSRSSCASMPHQPRSPGSWTARSAPATDQDGACY
jgi:hypothetical protein